MITTHDIGRHLNCYGVKTIHSPNIDKLAHKWIMFTNFYSTSSVCTPGRGGLHTGRYPQSNGLLGLSHAPWWWRLNDDEKHTAEILRSNGYETYLIGVNHVFNVTGKDHIQVEADRLGYNHTLSPRES